MTERLGIATIKADVQGIVVIIAILTGCPAQRGELGLNGTVCLTETGRLAPFLPLCPILALSGMGLKN